MSTMVLSLILMAVIAVGGLVFAVRAELTSKK